MEHFLSSVEFLPILTPDLSLWETVLRGTIMYLALFVLLRLSRRESSGLSLGDVLLITLLGDAAQNGMTGDTHSIADAGILILTIMGWDRLIDWSTWRSRRMRAFLRPQPLALIADGKVLRDHLRQEWITVDELRTQLRLAGVEEVSQVHRCFLEPDGNISVVRNDAGG